MNNTSQSTMPNEFQPQLFPPLSLRVGVTGARALSLAQQDFIRAAVDSILHLIRDQVGKIAADPRAASLYAHDETLTVPIGLRIVSALAEGADCVVAEEAIKLGYELFAPLPFPIGVYEKDFTDGLERFQRLATQGHLLELDGTRGEDENASYEAVGHFVVRNCDLLIALWDGKPARGRGGTGQIVEFAATQSNVPIWWIDYEAKSAHFIANARDWSHRGIEPNEAKARDTLCDHLAKTLLPRETDFTPRPGMLGHAIDHVCVLCKHNPPPFRLYKEEQIPPPESALWNTYSWLIKIIAGAAPNEAAPAMTKAETQIEVFWEKHYHRADRLSIAYAKRYRSSYVLIIFAALAAFFLHNVSHFFMPSLVAYVLNLLPEATEIWLCRYYPTTFAKTLFELIPLSGVGILVFLNHYYRWQDRWIDYRLLAELCRKQIMLSPLGRTLPGAEINDIAQDDSTDSEPPRELWVSHYFQALMRSAPHPETDIKLDKQRAFALGRSLIDEQSEYHRRREIQTKEADETFLKIGETSIFVTIGALVLVMCVIFVSMIFSLNHYNVFENISEGIEFLALISSGVSATFVALRAYAEFALLARQSQRMQSIMKEMSTELTDLDLSCPLSSLALGTTLQRLAVLMMQEVGGWAQLFRLKSIEMH